MMLSIFFTLNIKALDDAYIVNDEDASIRYKTDTSEQGLRFTAKLDEGVKGNAHGFYLVYGNVTIEDLRNAVNKAKGKDFELNGKKVKKVEIGGVTQNNEFSVVVTGVPEHGYIDKISAVGYVMVSSVIRYVEAVTTKSILEVALKTLNTGETNTTLKDIINNITHNVVLCENALKDLELNNTFYEYNHHRIKVLFAEDFYKITKIDFSLTLSATEIYSFFTDSIMKDKWGFLLDYFLSLSNNINLVEQINDLKNNDKKEHVKELIYALFNFFNEQNVKVNDDIIDFTNLENYLSLKNYNESVYINPNDHYIYKVGDQIKLPEADTDNIGYGFDHYLINGNKYSAGSNYVITNSKVVLNKVFVEKTYEVKFVDNFGNVVKVENVLRNDYITEFPEIDLDGHVLISYLDSNGEEVNEETPILSNMTIVPFYKIAITDIYFKIDKEGYAIKQSSNNIDYKFEFDTYNWNYLIIWPKEGYAFSKDVVIVAVYLDNTPVKEVNLDYSPEFITYTFDDPNWSGRY